MPDDTRRDDERYRSDAQRAGQAQPHGQGGYADPGRESGGYGRAGGYDERYGNPGQSQNVGQGQPHGQGYGQGYGQDRAYGGGQPYVQGGHTSGAGGPTTGFQPGQGGYTGQTGTGYGQTWGGEAGGQARPAQGGDYRRGAPDEGRSWWDKTRDFFGGDDRGQGAGGPHRGKGPRNYSRADERIRDDVNDRLTDDPFLDASDVEVAVEAGEVTLSGKVSSRSDKRRAEDLADNVSGVRHVQNNLRVESAAGPSGG